jgi:hypothetical protein
MVRFHGPLTPKTAKTEGVAGANQDDSKKYWAAFFIFLLRTIRPLPWACWPVCRWGGASIAGPAVPTPQSSSRTQTDDKKYSIETNHEENDRRGIILYLEYQSVCPFFLIGYTRPLPVSECVPPLWNQRGGRQHSLAGEGTGGANSNDWRESLALCILCGNKRGGE